MSADVTVVVREGSPSRSRTFNAGEGSDDGTGLYIWPSSYVLARWLVTAPEITAGKVIYELGSGCGLGGMTAAVLAHARRIVLTDLTSATLDNLRHNIRINDGARAAHWCEPEVLSVDWRHHDTWPLAGSADLVLGSDLVYDDGVVELLARVLAHVLSPGGEFVHVHPAHGRVGTSDLAPAMQAVGFSLVTEAPVPRNTYVRPESLREEGSDLHSMWHVLNEVDCKVFILQRFRKA